MEKKNITAYDVLIVGSGFAGATMANLLAASGRKILVIEKNEHVGGQCYDYPDENGIIIHQYGPHIFHTKKKEVWDYVNRFSGFNSYRHKVLSYAEGRYFDFPINRKTINAVFGKSCDENEIAELLRQEVKKASFHTPPRSFRDVIVAQVGERIYSLFIENYTRKQWDCDPALLSAELAGRILIRTDDDDCFFTDPWQGIPVEGYSGMVRNMLSHPNITVCTGCDYFQEREKYAANLVVYTGELDRFFDFKYGKLEYRSVRLEFKTYQQESFQPVAVVNYPGEHPWTRITEFKKFTEKESPVTTVCYEYPDAGGQPFYVVPTARNKQLRERYMEEVERLEATGHFIFTGRLAEYKYYNMDDVIEASLKKAAGWLQRFGK